MFRYYIFYKPFHVLTQFSPEGEKLTLSHFLPHLPKEIYPVGRLDFDSEGLLFLTDDKAITHKLLTPTFAHERTYWVQMEGIVTPQAIEQLQEGVFINVNGKRYKTKPAVAKILTPEPQVPERTIPIRYRKNIPTSWISLTLTEGKNRQVRRMTAAVGFPTLRLIRYSIGKVTIDGLQPGEYKEVGADIKLRLFTH
ncbi:MAG TPA: pseudouridine synthase [Flavipsychrobacter sp.]|nr:pseudouridine synthase [Flavipsychrobacter sp.]